MTVAPSSNIGVPEAGRANGLGLRAEAAGRSLSLMLALIKCRLKGREPSYTLFRSCRWMHEVMRAAYMVGCYGDEVRMTSLLAINEPAVWLLQFLTADGSTYQSHMQRLSEYCDMVDEMRREKTPIDRELCELYAFLESFAEYVKTLEVQP